MESSFEVSDEIKRNWEMWRLRRCFSLPWATHDVANKLFRMSFHSVVDREFIFILFGYL